MIKIAADRDPVSLYIFLYIFVNTLENTIIFTISCYLKIKKSCFLNLSVSFCKKIVFFLFLFFEELVVSRLIFKKSFKS